MKAVICSKYGSPDVLKFEEVAKPIPKDNEVLIKVHTAVVGPADCAFRKGDPFIVKIIYGLKKPKYSIMGTEFAGEIVEIGKDVTLFKKGDAVIGLSPDKFGAHAEFMCLAESKPMILKPKNMTFVDSVALCDGSPTSLTFLKIAAKIKSGDKVLINGASGAVGSAAVQLAKYYGGEVTGVCGTTNVGLVKSLGADYAIDYSKEDFTNSNKKYDIVFDTVGKSSFNECRNILSQKGIYLSTFPSLGIVFQMLLTSFSNGKKVKFVTAGLMQNKDNLNFLKKLAEEGTLKPLVDRVFSLEHTTEAHRYVDMGHKKGSAVIQIVV